MKINLRIVFFGFLYFYGFGKINDTFIFGFSHFSLEKFSVTPSLHVLMTAGLFPRTLFDSVVGFNWIIWILKKKDFFEEVGPVKQGHGGA